ncbi:unnamed protein product [Allacma fusca]|uniref:Protein kinase domain-containing protein n=1 Tax=Allacma fusca TaxID=39272 RepID=A0A8J2LU81_9HEXA|nr:unnamed protein product [Allacma fusca]
MDPPVMPMPQGLWKTNERPYFHSPNGPVNKFSRDLPWGIRSEVTDSPDTNLIAEEEGLEVNDLLGTGTFSSVYRGYWKFHKKDVAVKIYEKPRQNNPSQALPALKKVTAEVDALKCLSHPNITGFFGAMETKYRVYLVLELVENGNLLQYLKTTHPPGESPLSKKWFAQLASAVTYVHRKEIAHRDIKCENILLDKNLNIRLSDFGFAIPNITWFEDCANDVFVKVDEFCGSLAYMSPELVKKMEYCPILSDVWSMGIVLYAMLFAKFPYEQVSSQNIIHLSGKFRAPQGTKLSPALEDILRCIFQPAERRIRSYELLEKPWIEKEARAIFLGQMGHLSKDKSESILNWKNEKIPETIKEDLTPS